jgi:hypothetical protein
MKNLLSIAIIGLVIILSGCKKKSPDSCIDSSRIDNDVICTADYTPVCGCNGQTYSNACIAQSRGVLRYSPGACGCSYPYTGQIVDYTGRLGGCGLIMEMPNGTKLEIQDYPNNFAIQSGMMVEFDYKVITGAGSVCMVGDVIEITCIRDISCNPITTQIALPIQVIQQDPIDIISATIVGDCLQIDYSHSGGCQNHDYSLELQPLHCATPPIVHHLVFKHNANGDQCDALIFGTISYDLTLIKDEGGNAIQFQLNNEEMSFNKIYAYSY